MGRKKSRPVEWIVRMELERKGVGNIIVSAVDEEEAKAKANALDGELECGMLELVDWRVYGSPEINK